MGSKPLNLLFTRYRPGIYAGIGLAGDILASELAKNPSLRIHPFYIGRRGENYGALRKAWFQAIDVLQFAITISTRQFHLVHLNTVLAEGALFRDFIVVLLCRIRRVRCIVEFHGSKKSLLVSPVLGVQFAVRNILRLATHLVVVSREEQQNFLDYGIKRNNISIGRNPISKISHRDANAKRVNNSAGFVNLLFISRFDESKGLLDVIEAFAEVRKSHSLSKLILAGDGEAKEQAKNLVSDLRIGEFVEFHGWLPEIMTEELYATADMLVFPTYYYQEGFPMVVLHALSAGLPIITTRYRAMADYLEEGTNCLFVEPRNPSDLGAKMDTLIRDKRLCAKMRRENIQLATEFTSEKVAEEFSSIYQAVFRKGSDD